MLYLVHHGDAVGPDVDPMRPLSDRGRLHVERIAQEAAARGVKPQVIWHSGKLRARQTAEAFWKYCNALAEFSAARGLQPDDPPEWMRDVLTGESRDVMLAGHFPHLPRLRLLLVSGASGSAALDFPLHGLVALEHQDERCVERWRIGEP